MDFVSCFIAIKADAMLVQTTFAEVWNHPKFGEKKQCWLKLRQFVLVPLDRVKVPFMISCKFLFQIETLNFQGLK